MSLNIDSFFMSLHEEKSHTCEEGGAHLRISFWHLLTEFELSLRTSQIAKGTPITAIDMFHTA